MIEERDDQEPEEVSSHQNILNMLHYIHILQAGGSIFYPHELVIQAVNSLPGKSGGLEVIMGDDGVTVKIVNAEILEAIKESKEGPKH